MRWLAHEAGAVGGAAAGPSAALSANCQQLRVPLVRFRPDVVPLDAARGAEPPPRDRDTRLEALARRRVRGRLQDPRPLASHASPAPARVTGGRQPSRRDKRGGARGSLKQNSHSNVSSESTAGTPQAGCTGACAKRAI